MLKPDRITGLVPTSQAGTNQPHTNTAMTAPGGASASAESIFIDNTVQQPLPGVDAIDFSASNTREASEPRSKPLIRLGQWNELP
jgi:hypothetical protein